MLYTVNRLTAYRAFIDRGAALNKALIGLVRFENLIEECDGSSR